MSSTVLPLGGPINTYDWDMGGTGNYINATNSNSPNPQYIYDNPGVYQVILTVTDINGCQGYDTNTVIVDTLPIADFSATEVCHNDITEFTDNSIGTSATVDQWNWNMGGTGNYVNTTSSNSQNPQYIYDNPGTYTVILTITDTNNCIHSDTNTVIVRPVSYTHLTLPTKA